MLRTLDKTGLVSQRGYQIIINSFALKIFDERESARNPQRSRQFYTLQNELTFAALREPAIQAFIKRMKGLHDAARPSFRRLMSADAINWSNEGHVRTLCAVCSAFQDYSFTRPRSSDLYQLVFYNFANQFKRDEAAPFLTPIPVIEFLTRIVNPREGQTVIDPCCSIGDFLSLSFVNSLRGDGSQALADANIFGVDLDESMTILAALNMLLNGDGNARLFLQT